MIIFKQIYYRSNSQSRSKVKFPFVNASPVSSGQQSTRRTGWRKEWIHWSMLMDSLAKLCLASHSAYMANRKGTHLVKALLRSPCLLLLLLVQVSQFGSQQGRLFPSATQSKMHASVIIIDDHRCMSTCQFGSRQGRLLPLVIKPKMHGS